MSNQTHEKQKSARLDVRQIHSKINGIRPPPGNTWLSRDASDKPPSQISQQKQIARDRSGKCLPNQGHPFEKLSALPLSVWRDRNCRIQRFAPSLTRLRRASSSPSLAFLSSKARTSPRFFRPGVSDKCTLKAITSASATSMANPTRSNRSQWSSNASLADCSCRLKGPKGHGSHRRDADRSVIEHDLCQNPILCLAGRWTKWPEDLRSVLRIPKGPPEIVPRSGRLRQGAVARYLQGQPISCTRVLSVREVTDVRARWVGHGPRGKSTLRWTRLLRFPKLLGWPNTRTNNCVAIGRPFRRGRCTSIRSTSRASATLIPPKTSWAACPALFLQRIRSCFAARQMSGHNVYLVALTRPPVNASPRRRKSSAFN